MQEEDLSQQIQSAFHRALELAGEARERHLASLPTAVSVEVSSLLAADSETDDFLEAPLVRLADLVEPDGSFLERLGPYRVTGELEGGGMARVFVGVRDDDAYEKMVAIKVLRRELHQADLLERFRRERQILANLDHPSIARLIDGGETPDGRPYLVMDYVDGMPLETYCDQKGLTVRQRIELFLTVCQAVQVAHRNLVVHRDLKSSNILVTPEGEPRLLDFGIAKLLSPEEFQIAVEETVAGTGPRTAYYASPEQLLGGAITTATDVYSLGVLLYRLLAGRLPYRLEKNVAREVEHWIVEQAPIPLTRALDVEQTVPGDVVATEVAKMRSSDLRGLKRSLEGDLENVVQKALEKDLDRRYSSVDDLAADLERYLRGLPVEARGDTVGYRVSKFVARNRLAVAALCLVALVLTGFSIMTTVQARRIAAERDRAAAERDRAQVALDFVQEIFRGMDPLGDEGTNIDEISAREILDRGVLIANENVSDPGVQRKLLETIGQIYNNVGSYQLAREAFQQALDVDVEAVDPDRPALDQVSTLLGLAVSLRETGEYERAREIFRQLEGWLEDSDFPVAVRGRVLLQHGLLEKDTGEMERAEALIRQAVAYEEELGDPKGLAMDELAIHMFETGRLVEARATLEKLLIRREASFGREHPLRAEILNNLGVLAGFGGDFDTADRMLREALQYRKAAFGELHTDVAESVNNLGNLLTRTGELDEAERLFRESVQIEINLRGETSTRVAESRINLGLLLSRRGRMEESEGELRGAVEIYRAAGARDNPNFGIALTGLGTVLVHNGDCDEALVVLDQAAKIMSSLPSEGNWRVGEIQVSRGICLGQRNRSKEAQSEIEGGLEVMASILPPDHLSVVRAQEALQLHSDQ